MATFAKASFNAASYATFRPSYPASVFRTVLNYHQGPKNVCLDLGCGHGVVSREFAPSFTKVIGTDPSEVMVTQARSSTKEPNVEFRQGMAEDMGFIEDGSLDMLVAGQAAHWFDYSKLWPVLNGKMKKGGTLAFFGYKDHSFVDYPKATKILDHYCYGPGKNLLGMYWEQPGRNILRDRYRDIVPPESEWESVERLEYEPGLNGPNTGTLGERLMHKRLTLGELEGYGRTFSSFHAWQEVFPEKKSRSEGGPGDVIDEMFDVMREAELDWKKEGEDWREKVVEVEWGSVILMARKK